ncbi:hypothetical protein LK09_08245 [Microbacterium mangrovi]|uniref:Uncharacterized protein n=1 Tax=Microbacterium mangrovi TaxID=1348253 RepID=A0A0B2AAR7_9MICO|nr:hypothetical protein [Microbacterium mangrovi]KHK98848.1 hypothetical protein LK09_08245 [Microbacterium mangrovi]
MADDARVQSAWRPDDIVAYEEMRDLAVETQTLLIDRARRGGQDAEDSRAEASNLRHETLAVDGFDRSAIDEQTRRIAQRLIELRAEVYPDD